MKKIILSLVFSCTVAVSAQVGVSIPSKNPENKWVFGGGAGVSFGNNGGFGIQLSPRVGYKIADNLVGGLDADFYWQSDKYIRSNMVGIGPFLTYYIANSVYLGATFKEYFYNQKIKDTDEKFNGDEPALYLGGGYMQKIGNRTYMQIGVMYNVLWKENESVFSSGFVPSIGVVFGI